MLNFFVKPNVLLKLEGLAILGLAVILYHQQNFSWYTFLWLFLVPDIAMVFYVFSPSVGAMAYNLTHSKILPVILVALGLIYHVDSIILLSLIWFAHIGFDRMLGYGLKYPDSFGHTHLGWVGKQKMREGEE